MTEATNIKPIIEAVLHKARERSRFKKEDEELIKRAYIFAEKCHHNQRRKTGAPYITHSLATALSLAELGMDAKTIAAGLLHDVPEDTPCTQEEIKKEFGEEVSKVVAGVTRLGGVKYFGKKGRAEDLRKLLLIMAKDLRVVVVKLADRLHNMQTLDVLPAAKRKKIAIETMEIYAPLASRLGMGEMRGRLEDLSLKYYLPKEYKRIVSLIGKGEQNRKEHVGRVIKELKLKLSRAKIRAVVEGRTKHLYSFYKKFKKHNDDISKIYDLVAVRIIVDTISDCYKALGIVHADWKPLIKRIKDYIAVPKPNGYRSIHTTVFCLDGQIIEIQIKTHKMHEEAEWGIASHWHYEDNKESKTISKRLNWINQLIEWQKDLEVSAFLEGLKVDVFKDRIFVFTPKGEGVDLPEGATPIDFAYLIHTQIGNSCIGAKVNNKIVHLNSALQNGDMVEILTSKKTLGPSRDWLRYVKTSLALYSIRRWFIKEDRDKNLFLGKELLSEELRKIGKSVDKIPRQELYNYLKKTNYQNLDSLLVAIGRGFLNPRQVVSVIYLKEEKIPVKKGLLGKILPFFKGKPKVKIISEGEGNFLISFASCCKPKPPQKIVGFITRGKGLTVHKKTCPNLKKEDKKRFIPVFWDFEKIHNVSIYIEAENSPSFLNDLTRLLKELKIKIKDIHLKNGKTSKITAHLEITKVEQLNKVLEKASNLPEVKVVKKL